MKETQFLFCSQFCIWNLFITAAFPILCTVPDFPRTQGLFEGWACDLVRASEIQGEA